MHDSSFCEPTIFKNKARVYWQFNCDSEWVTFEDRNGKKKVIFGLDSDLVDLTGRIGYVDQVEYKSTFLAQYNVISGCCTPPEFTLYNKENGKIEKQFGTLVFFNDNPKFPIAVKYIDNHTLRIYNIDTRKKYIVKLQKGFREDELNRPEQLMVPSAMRSFLTIVYPGIKGKKTRIVIDMRKYCQ